MQIPAVPRDETKRLLALTSLGILDTPGEERFDRITRLACRTLNVPIALVSLIDRDRQWIKSKQGLDACQTSREVSFCGHAILQEGPLIVPDALLDGRFSDNPLVVGEPRIRFYAGQPIRTPSGSRIGALCVIDRRPREFPREDVATLLDLAGLVERELDLLDRSATDELTGISNRRGFMMVAERILELCRRRRQSATVVGIDLNEFKTINDRCGHGEGDSVLRAFSRILSSNFRKSDVVARFGGDEFVVLCSNTSSRQLAGPFGRLQREFRNSPLADRHPALSWSTGFADFNPDSSARIEDLLHEADANMYAAKAGSRRS